MMWASEYIAAATAQISDPVKAAEVTRELLTHLEEIKAEAIAAGVEADMAEAMALTRMGPVEALAASLAEIHHSPLPWRHYLAVVPVVGILLLMAGPPYMRWPAMFGLVLLLIVALVPGAPVWRRAWLGLRADIRQKLGWVQRQPLREAAKVAFAGTAGVGFCMFLMVLSMNVQMFGVSWLPILVLLVGLPLPIVGHWGRQRYGFSPYLLVTLAALEVMVALLLVAVVLGKRTAADITLIVGAVYLPEGLLVVRALDWWRRRQLSVRVVIEKGAPN